ncbi:MAG TPA: ABC transporter ATP-binding protein [Bryobacteraceae bacterium]|nr:ABC transporter ATP-binding protein [Bryobacteraceae bacterium]
MASPSQAEPVIRLEKLTRAYRSGAAEIVVFRDLDLDVAEGEQVAVMGESGAGKSTLLYLIAGLDRPTSGAVRIRGRDIAAMSEAEVARFRNREIGYVWQQHHLLSEFTCAENVMMPRLVSGESQSKALEAAKERLAEVGLADRAGHRAGELSGGEQQRVAIARALIGNPSLLLADEPTGNLDERTGERVFEMLTNLRRTRNLTSLLVTHNAHFAASCGRVLKLEAGRLCKV